MLLLLFACLELPSCAFVRGYGEGRSTRMLALESLHEGRVRMGMARFVFDDLGNLNTDALKTNAVPWKVVAASLVLDSAKRQGTPIDPETLNTLLKSFGFIRPSTVDNWDNQLPPPTFERPMGIVSGYVVRSVPPFELEAANLSCAACHAGVLYDRNGLPENRVWLGLPNTSINFEAYSKVVYQSLKNAVRSEPELLTTVRRLFPDVSPREMQTIERHVIPKIKERLRELESTIDAPTPFGNGGPGLTNVVASLKLQLGLLRGDRYNDELGYISIPDLAGVALRTSLLYDGLYAAPGVARFRPMAAQEVTNQHVMQLARIVSFFTVPSMGAKAETAERAIPQVEDIFRFIQSYRPPPFPGPIDAALAASGRQIYHANCARCHGTYSEGLTDVTLIEFPNRLCPQEEMNTDPERWKAIDPQLIAAIRASTYKTFIVPEAAKGYVAPRLTGLWATAPYLHNGSVPTLWHLMHPKERPSRFHVGGHRLDLSRVGIAGAVDSAGILRYPEGYEPWATPDLYDTAQPGRSNRGHEREFESISEADKQSLLEYLKLL